MDLSILTRINKNNSKRENNIKEKNISERRAYDKFWSIMFLVSSTIGMSAVILISVFIIKQGLPMFREVSVKDFLLRTTWKPSSSIPHYGVLSFIVASVEVTGLALLFALPISLSTAIYLSEMASKRSANIIRNAVEIMQGIPSVIYGLFGIALIVPIIRRLFGGNGYSILSASIILAIMIMPTLINVSEVSIHQVSQDLRLASLALGGNENQTITKVVLPSVKSGIIVSIVLSLGRAIGETTAVLLVAGNAPLFPRTLTSMGRTLTMNIVTDMSYAEGTHMNALFATALLLYVFIMLLNSVVICITHKSRKGLK